MQPINDLMQRAFAHHQAGRLADAKRLYRKIRDQQPRHFDALHLLGAIAIQEGDYASGAQLIAEALAINPSIPAVHNNLGYALLALKRYEDALGSFDKAIALDIIAACTRLIESAGPRDNAFGLSDAYNERGRAKLLLGLAKGKTKGDKRESIKERDWKRDKARLMRDRG